MSIAVPMGFAGLTGELGDIYGNPYGTDPIRAIGACEIAFDEIDRNGTHTMRIASGFRRNIAARDTEMSSMKITEEGTGRVAFGLIYAAEDQISDNGDGSITLTMPNILELLRFDTTGSGWVAANGIGVIFNRLVTLGPGWSMNWLDNGPASMTSGGCLWNATSNVKVLGNTLFKDPALKGTDGFDNFCYSLQQIGGGDGSVSFVVHDTTNAVAFGMATGSPGIGLPALRHCFIVNAGTLSIMENFAYKLFQYTTVKVGDVLTIQYSGGFVQYLLNGTWHYGSALAPVYPVAAGATLYQNGSMVDNAVISYMATPYNAAWVARFEQATLLGAIDTLTTGTGKHYRLGRDSNGEPNLSVDIGVMGDASPFWFMNAQGGNPNQIHATPEVRLIKTITRKRDTSRIANIGTPIGGGSGSQQVTLWRLWSILHDPNYPNYGRFGNRPDTVFPEYNPNYDIGFKATLDGRIEYFMYSVTGLAKRGGVRIACDLSDNQYNYVDGTVANQEKIQRALYYASMIKLRDREDSTVSYTITADGWGRPPRAGSKVHVTFDHTAVEPGSPMPFADFDVDEDLYFIGGKRSYGDSGGTDTIEVSNKLVGIVDAQAKDAERAKKADALRLIPQTGIAGGFIGPIQREADGTHRLRIPFYVPDDIFRPIKMQFSVEKIPARHTVIATASQNVGTTASQSVTITTSQSVTNSGSPSVTNTTGASAGNTSGSSTPFTGASSANTTGNATNQLSYSVNLSHRHATQVGAGSPTTTAPSRLHFILNGGGTNSFIETEGQTPAGQLWTNSWIAGGATGNPDPNHGHGFDVPALSMLHNHDTSHYHTMYHDHTYPHTHQFDHYHDISHYHDITHVHTMQPGIFETASAATGFYVYIDNVDVTPELGGPWQDSFDLADMLISSTLFSHMLQKGKHYLEVGVTGDPTSTDPVQLAGHGGISAYGFWQWETSEVVHIAYAV